MTTDIARSFFIGRLTRDIEVLYSNNGNLFGVMTVAVHIYQGKNLPEKTSFFRITVPGRTVDSIGSYLTKGRQVAVDAVPVMNSWTDKDGNNRSRIQFDATHIQLLAEPRQGRQHEEPSSTGETNTEHVQQNDEYQMEYAEEEGLFEEDMPF